MQTVNSLIGNRYQIVNKLGGGGQKTVYLAQDLRLNRRPCALAEMIDSFADAEEQKRAIAAFQREADLLAALKDEHIPQIYDKFSEGQNHYLVMEYIEGGTLESRLRAAGGALPVGEVVDVGLQVLETLEYLHGLRPPIVYRDMKPGNIMITPAGKVKLIDFGIARFFQATRMTTFGTEGYAPKEQYSGMVEQRSDLYALGATLHEALSGRNPIPFDFPPLILLRPGCNRALSELIAQALADRIEDRVPSAQEFRRRLLAIKSDLQVPAGATPGVKGATDPTVPLRKNPPSSDSETLILDTQKQSPRVVSNRNDSQRSPAQIGSQLNSQTRRSDQHGLMAAEAETAVLRGQSAISTEMTERLPQDRLPSGATEIKRSRAHRRTGTFIAAASVVFLAVAAFGGVYAWSEFQRQKAIQAAQHDALMKQIEERAAEEAQREQNLQRERDLERQQEAAREQQWERQQQAMREQEQNQREAAALLRRKQQQEARRERRFQPPAPSSNPGYAGSESYPPATAANPNPNTNPDLTGAVASGISAAIGGALGNSVGQIISGGSAPGYAPSYPPNYPRRHPGR